VDEFQHRALVLVKAYKHTKFQLPSSISFGDMGYGGGPNKKLGAADLPRRPLMDKFLHRTIVFVNAYQCTKFIPPSSISFGDMKSVPK